MTVSINEQKVESFLQKIRRGYKEQGIEGLWLNIKRIYISKIKKYMYQRSSVQKNDILKELSDIKAELRVIRAGQLFLYSEINKATCLIENKKSIVQQSKLEESFL